MRFVVIERQRRMQLQVRLEKVRLELHPALILKVRGTLATRVPLATALRKTIALRNIARELLFRQFVVFLSISFISKVFILRFGRGPVCDYTTRRLCLVIKLPVASRNDLRPRVHHTPVSRSVHETVTSGRTFRVKSLENLGLVHTGFFFQKYK